MLHRYTQHVETDWSNLIEQLQPWGCSVTYVNTAFEFRKFYPWKTARLKNLCVPQMKYRDIRHMVVCHGTLLNHDQDVLNEMPFSVYSHIFMTKHTYIKSTYCSNKTIRKSLWKYLLLVCLSAYLTRLKVKQSLNSGLISDFWEKANVTQILQMLLYHPITGDKPYTKSHQT